MELTMKTLCFLAVFLISTCCIYGVPVTNITGTTKTSLLQDLDPANLQTLNRETRKVLLQLIGDELATTRVMMKHIQPEVKKCQQRVDQRYSECVHCVDMKCQNRYKECNGSIEIIAPNSGGVSISSSVNEHGKPITTICTVIWGQSDACTTVMNPNGAFATSINSMGNTLHVHLQSVVNDLGGNVGMFVNQMQSVVGDINSTSIPNEELERMLNELNTGLSGMQFELQHMMDGFGQDMQQSFGNMGHSVSQIGQNVNQMASSGGPNVNQIASQRGPLVQQAVSQITPNVNRMVSQANIGLSQINPNVNNYVSSVNSGVNNMLYNLHQGLGQWGQNFGQSLNNMMAGIFGRKKRQAKIIADPTHEVRCENMLKNSTVCAEYRSKCKSCPQTSNVTEGDVIKQVCGSGIVDKVVHITDKLTELTQIEQLVVTSQTIIERIEIDKSSWNVDKFAFNKVYVTANIKGEPVRFSSKSSLNIMDLPSTGQSIANQIWRYWNNPAVQKPK